MNPVTLDFLRRMRWLFLAQFIVTAISWTLPAAQFARLHLEFLAAVAMSIDLGRGLIRVTMGLPLTQRQLGGGLWMAVVPLAPLVGVAGMLAGSGLGALTGRLFPSPSLLYLHALIGLLIAGTMQFLITGLPTRQPRTLGEKTGSLIFSTLWGLSMGGGIWVSFFIPPGWERLSPGLYFLVFALAALTMVSWFTTQSMVRNRAATSTVNLTAVPGPASAPLSGLQGPGGWRLWLGQELRWQIMAPLMTFAVTTIMEVMAHLSNPGVAGAMRGSSNRYLPAGMMCAWFISALFSMASSPARAFRSLPVTRTRYALLLTCRPLCFALLLFFTLAGITFCTGTQDGQEGKAFSLFLLIGGMVSLTQAILVRFPSFSVMMLMAMLLAPCVVFTFPVVLKDGVNTAWMPPAALALVLLSWSLHRRWLRTSSGFYRSQGQMRWMGGARQS